MTPAPPCKGATRAADIPDEVLQALSRGEMQGVTLAAYATSPAKSCAISGKLAFRHYHQPDSTILPIACPLSSSPWAARRFRASIVPSAWVRVVTIFPRSTSSATLRRISC